MVRFTPIYEEVENGWIQGRIKELPGVITAAPTRDEARDMLADALHEFVAFHVEEGKPLPVQAETPDEVALA
jgi:predicted RNase H-like HicB family nuclease